MKILVTGANGFVGKGLCHALVKNGHHVIAVVRDDKTNVIATDVICRSLDANTNFQDLLMIADAVIHLAARTHVVNDKAKNPYQAYADINIETTKNLALQASVSGVKRFIFLSSVKANGETTVCAAFNEQSTPNPEDDYGKTKLQAEKELIRIASNSNMEFVIIRPPLIYGSGVKANFKNLVEICQTRLPLPFGAIQNKRSLIYIDNLIDFLMTCISSPQAANQTFLISDDDDVSTTQLTYTIREALNVPAMLVPISQTWLAFLFTLIGKKTLATRLCGNLQVDITKAKTLLGWKPPFTFEQGIKNTIQEK